MVRVVALAVIIALAAIVYAFTQKQDASAMQLALANTTTELNTMKATLNQSAAQAKTAKADLESCKSQVTEVQTALDNANAAMASKKPAGKK